MSRREQYRRYLKSPEWSEQRTLAMARTSGFCQFCGNFAEHVHHVRYPKVFGQEHPHSVVPVCERCHNMSHGAQPLKTLTNVVQMQELSPNGGALKYLLSGARVYASGPSWARALQVPDAMRAWFLAGLARTAILKKDSAGGELEMSYLNVPVYRWHAVAELLRSFDRQWYQSEFKGRPKVEQRQIEIFHNNYERLISWGYDLQERALSTALSARPDPAAPVTQETLINVMKEAVAPRLREQDARLEEHHVVIEEIKEAVPTLRDAEDFITVKQAIVEQGLDPTVMPLYPQSRENLSGLAGQMLKSKGAEQGTSEIARVDGQSISTEVRTYRRKEIYAVLEEILKNRPRSLPLASGE